MTSTADDAADDYADFEARTRAASALRRRGHAIVGHEVDAAGLHAIADDVEARLPAVESGARRQRHVEMLKRNVFTTTADGERIGTFPDCVVSGDANPMGIGVKFFREGTQAVAHVYLDSAFEGAPDRAHGGVVAAVFDDLMGFVLHIVEAPAFTGELTIRYKAPTPIRTELEFRAWLRERDGRKLWIDAEATHDGKVLCTASGLFIAIDRERFGLAGAPPQ